MGIVARLLGKKPAPTTIPLGEVAYRNLLADCVRDTQEMNAQLEALYGIDRHDRWDLNQETGVLALSRAGTTLLRAEVAIAGSHSPARKQWLWGWADGAVSAKLAQPSLRVREYGDMHRLTDLTEPTVAVTDDRAWRLAPLACRILGGSGVYRGALDVGYLFLVITDIEVHQPPAV